MRVRWRLPLAFAVATLVFAGIVALVAALALRGVFLDRLEDEMLKQARQYAAALVSMAGDPGDTEGGAITQEALQSLTQQLGSASGVRFTVIDSDGWVLADSEADPTSLENHATRPEVAQALAGNESRARRPSTTLGHEEVYVAVPLPAAATIWSDGVVRVAQPASRVDATVAASWRIPLIVWAVLLAPMLLAAYLLTRSITHPVERLRRMTAQVAAGDLSHRTSVHRRDELGSLADSLNTMAAQLETRDEQLRSEMERSAQVLTAMAEGVLVVDAEGRLIRYNPAAEHILQVDLSQAEGTALIVAARAFPSQSLADQARKAGHATSQVIDLAGGRSLAVEVVPLSPAGTPGDGTQARPAGGSPTLFVIRDETARRNTERVRRDFATNVSHELKTPLAGLSLLAETLRGAVNDDPAQADKFVLQLSKEVGRLTDLTNDLLTLSRLEEPDATTETEYAPVDFSDLTAEVAEEVRPAAKAKQHQLAADITHGLKMNGDDVALRTMVRNLLENAVRYAEPGGHITLRDQEGEGRAWVVLSVADDGVGIPLADQRRVFERFYRVDKARSRETGGTGLGLSIVRHVAERHGGRVELKSTVGVGSTFTVRLPAI
jgi:two-component system phosphate regulon sensor histidine kinase PhoR